MSTIPSKRSKPDSLPSVPERIYGFVLQGGGALGAFEWGAVECLLDRGISPDVVSGVSIGAINATVLCGHRAATAKAGLQALWNSLTTPSLPFVPEQVNAQFSLFGNPGMYEPRFDYYNFAHWTSYYDTSPLHATLRRLVDFAQLCPTGTRPQLLLAATDVKTGDLDTFDSRAMSITPAHVAASGSLPPSFPATLAPASPEAGGAPTLYWDGGLFDNTPLNGVIDALQASDVPEKWLFVFNLFPSKALLPTNLTEVSERIAALIFGNKMSRELKRANKVTDLIEFSIQFEQLMERVGHLDSKLQNAVRDHQAELDALARPYGLDLKELIDNYRGFRELQNLKGYQAIKHYGAKINIVEITNEDVKGGSDFSAAALEHRRQLGYQSAATAVVQNGLTPAGTEVAAA